MYNYIRLERLASRIKYTSAETGRRRIVTRMYKFRVYTRRSAEKNNKNNNNLKKLYARI